jgi:hypothetical protein
MLIIELNDASAQMTKENQKICNLKVQNFNLKIWQKR